MIKKQYANQSRVRRHQRVRKKVAGTLNRPRLAVFRSANDIYVQVIDDAQRRTLVFASSREADAKSASLDALDAMANVAPATPTEAEGAEGGESAATAEGGMPEAIKGLASNRRVRQAFQVGQLIAQRAKAAGIERVVFDRGGYIYHGRVAALAEGARAGGLNF
jgi:large subunit ribosomal protein L18